MPTAPKPKSKLDRRVLILAVAIVVVVGGGVGALAYLGVSNQTVYVENAQIEAPTVDLGPTAPGILQSVDVAVGDMVAPNTVVAQVGTELIKAQQGGLVTVANEQLGAQITPGQTVVETIDPTQLRVVGQVQEDKGLADIHAGQRAVFTVDAFGSEKFGGVVDEVSPTAQSGDVVFNISDQRQEQNFDVKVRFDTAANPQLKNGMSAKLWVYKQ